MNANRRTSCWLILLVLSLCSACAQGVSSQTVGGLALWSVSASCLLKARKLLRSHFCSLIGSPAVV
jgi:hypothetical protein